MATRSAESLTVRRADEELRRRTWRATVVPRALEARAKPLAGRSTLKASSEYSVTLRRREEVGAE